MASFLACDGARIFSQDQPARLELSCAPGRFEIVDLPLGEYDQSLYVCRQTAEFLAAKYPDWMRIEHDH